MPQVIGNKTERFVSILEKLRDPTKLNDEEIIETMDSWVKSASKLSSSSNDNNNDDDDVEQAQPEDNGDKYDDVDWKFLVEEKGAVNIFHSCLQRIHPDGNYYIKVTECVNLLVRNGKQQCDFGGAIVKEIIECGMFDTALKSMESHRSMELVVHSFQRFLEVLVSEKGAYEVVDYETLTINRIVRPILENTLQTIEGPSTRDSSRCFVVACSTLIQLGCLPPDLLPKLATAIRDGLTRHSDDGPAQELGGYLLRSYSRMAGDGEDAGRLQGSRHGDVSVFEDKTAYLASLLDKLQDPFALDDHGIIEVLHEIVLMMSDDLEVKDGEEGKIDWKIIQQKGAVEVFHKCMRRIHHNPTYYLKVIGGLLKFLDNADECGFGAEIVHEIIDTGTLDSIIPLMDALISEEEVQLTFQGFLGLMTSLTDKKDRDRIVDKVAEATLKTLERYATSSNDIYTLGVNTIGHLRGLPAKYFQKTVNLVFRGLIAHPDDEQAQTSGFWLLQCLVGKEKAKELMDHAEFHHCEGGCA